MAEVKRVTKEVTLKKVTVKSRFDEKLGDNGRFSHDSADIEDGNLTSEVRLKGITMDDEVVYFTVDEYTFDHEITRPKHILRAGTYTIEDMQTYKKGTEVVIVGAKKPWSPEVTTHLGGYATFES